MSAKPGEDHDRFTLPFGKTSRVDQPWNEQRLSLRTSDGRAITLALRAYDDAFAFRYEIGALPGEETLRIAAETTAFGLAPPRVVHASWLEHFRHSHEYPVRSTALDAIPDGQLLDTPLTVEFDDGAALAITEASRLRFAGMSRARRRGSGNRLEPKNTWPSCSLRCARSSPPTSSCRHHGSYSQ